MRAVSPRRAIVSVEAPDEDVHGRLAYPLDTFYDRTGRALPRMERVAEEEVPQPYRALLCGDHDMTPTLEAYHGERLHLRVYEYRRQGAEYSRLVGLTTDRTGRVVEFGAIVIHLQRFPPDAAARVLEGRTPLGTILAEHAIPHTSHPSAFLRIAPDAVIEEALQIAHEGPLYGRRNVLATPAGEPLAEILEILPP